MLSFDYEQFDKRGLRKITDWLDKESLPVRGVTGTNKPKRESGFQVKEAVIEFESSQKLSLKAKPNAGTFFQAKLNGKVLGIKDYKSLDNEMREIAALVRDNEPNYIKNREKNIARQKIKVDLPKAVNTTTSERTAAAEASIAMLTAQKDAIGSQRAEASAKLDLQNQSLAAVQEKLAAEKVATQELEGKIDNAEKGIFEGCPTDEADEADEADEEEEEDEEEEGEAI